jgi:hypothetical protein
MTHLACNVKKSAGVKLHQALIIAFLQQDALRGRDFQSIDGDECDLEAPVQITLLLDPDGFRDPSLAVLVTAMGEQFDGRR